MIYPTKVHTQTSNPIQSVVVRDVTALRVRHLRAHHDQHDNPRHEVPRPVTGVQQGVGHA